MRRSERRKPRRSPLGGARHHPRDPRPRQRRHRTRATATSEPRHGYAMVALTLTSAAGQLQANGAADDPSPAWTAPIHHCPGGGRGPRVLSISPAHTSEMRRRHAPTQQATRPRNELRSVTRRQRAQVTQRTSTAIITPHQHPRRQSGARSAKAEPHRRRPADSPRSRHPRAYAELERTPLSRTTGQPLSLDRRPTSASASAGSFAVGVLGSGEGGIVAERRSPAPKSSRISWCNG